MNTRVRRSLIAAVVLIAVGGATAAAIGVGGGLGAEPPPAVAAPATAEVTRETLVDFEERPGELGFGVPVALRYQPPAADPPSDGDGGGDGDPGDGDPGGGDTAGGGGTGGGTSGGTSGGGTGGDGSAGGGDGPPADDGQRLVTWLPRVGTILERGDTLLRVDNRPIVALHGPLPLYRSLRAGVAGPDVRQFERNLQALGYTGHTVDQNYSAATATVVRRWQRDLGVPATGMVRPGELVYVAGAIRVAAHAVQVGDSATGEILSYTGTVPAVTVTLPVDDQRYAEPGAEVTVALANGAETTGRVESVSQPTAGSGDEAFGGPGGEPTVSVTVSVRPADLGQQRTGPVTVRFVADRRDDVLTVPVVALVALVEGGYGVQVVEGGVTRYVAVDTGMFARGRVEITSPEITAGTTVVVPP